MYKLFIDNEKYFTCPGYKTPALEQACRIPDPNARSIFSSAKLEEGEQLRDSPPVGVAAYERCCGFYVKGFLHISVYVVPSC